MSVRCVVPQADLKRKETTMICCSANWGAGGYLSIRPNAAGPALAAPNVDGQGGSNPSPPPLPAPAGDARGNGAVFPPHAEVAELALVDATLANKPRAAVFRLVNCDGYTPQPFIGGKLMRGPGPPEGAGARQEGGGGGGGGGGWGAGGGSRAYSERQR